MYMLTVVTLMIALTGIYAQVLAVQTAQLYASRRDVIDNMMAWHATAVAQASYSGITFPTQAAAAAGCSLTSSLPSNCVNSVTNKSVALDSNNPGGLPSCTKTRITGGTPCWTSLPTGYRTTPYTFYSVYYQSGGQGYIMTYVPPPTISASNPAPGYIALPGAGGTQIGATASDLMRQIKTAGIEPLLYGTVQTNGAGPNILQSGGLVTGSIPYPLPTLAGFTTTMPINTIGIISEPFTP